VEAKAIELHTPPGASGRRALSGRGVWPPVCLPRAVCYRRGSVVSKRRPEDLLTGAAHGMADIISARHLPPCASISSSPNLWPVLETIDLSRFSAPCSGLLASRFPAVNPRGPLETSRRRCPFILRAARSADWRHPGWCRDSGVGAAVRHPAVGLGAVFRGALALAVHFGRPCLGDCFAGSDSKTWTWVLSKRLTLTGAGPRAGAEPTRVVAGGVVAVGCSGIGPLFASTRNPALVARTRLRSAAGGIGLFSC